VHWLVLPGACSIRSNNESYSLTVLEITATSRRSSQLQLRLYMPRVRVHALQLGHIHCSCGLNFARTELLNLEVYRALATRARS
jgi:hypothetical protein